MNYEYIHHASDERLAEMLEFTADELQHEWRAVAMEAARRLRRPKNIPFNNEQFE